MKIRDLTEASYPGNLGMIEMIKFYEVASEEQKATLKRFLERKQVAKVKSLLQSVLGVNLHSLT